MPTFLLMVIKKILELIKLVHNQIGDIVALNNNLKLVYFDYLNSDFIIYTYSM